MSAAFLATAVAVDDAPPAPSIADSSLDMRDALPPALLDGLPAAAVERMAFRRSVGLALARRMPDWRHLLRCSP